MAEVSDRGAEPGPNKWEREGNKCWQRRLKYVTVLQALLNPKHCLEIVEEKIRGDWFWMRWKMNQLLMSPLLTCWK